MKNNNYKCSYISYDDIVSTIGKKENRPLTKALLSCPILQTELIRTGVISPNDIDEYTSDDIFKQIENTPLDDWLDNQDVAEILHMSFRTLQKLRSDGILPYSRINGKIYYRRQDIQKLMADNFQNA